MIRKLPGWIWVGAILLPSIAGMVNAITFLGFTHRNVSHVTGNVTANAALLLEPGMSGFFETALVTLSFLAGAIFSGMIIGSETLRLGKRYGIALLAEGALLLMSWWFFRHGQPAGEFWASAACGLQNAMIATYSGSVLRTTHLTGVVSDIGSILGNLLAGRETDLRHLLLLCSIFAGFYGGGVLGVTLFHYFSFDALIFPSVFTLSLGSVYIYWLMRTI